MSSKGYEAFIEQVREIHLCESIGGLLDWDQETYMPPKGAETRAAQLSLIAGIAHKRLTSDEFARQLETVEAEGDGDPVVATNVRDMRRVHDRAVKLPTKLVQQIAQASSLARQAWVAARKESQFAKFSPHLEKLLDLKRQVAEKIGYDENPYDALMDEFEPGMRASQVQQVFDALKGQLVPLVQAIKDAPRQPKTAVLDAKCPVDAQARFGRWIAEQMGYDFEAGRLDTTTHPFCQGISPQDVRITSRYNETYLPMSLFGTMHEAGHALYEQGLDPEHAHTPAGMHVSLGIHESQSRMWENLVGRSRAFWEHYYGKLQAEFPALASVALEDWYFAINTVRPSLIRVEADEVTYNLHIMLRFDIERQMIAGKLKIADIPEAWNAAMQQMLGITPPDDAQGCLQDIHWSMGIFGYFPTYALGNLYAAQFFEAAREALPNLDGEIGAVRLMPLLEWLREHIHRQGKRYRAAELVERVTGKALSHEPFIEYLRGKYQPLYGF